MDADDDECEHALRELFGSLPPLSDAAASSPLFPLAPDELERAHNDDAPPPPPPADLHALRHALCMEPSPPPPSARAAPPPPPPPPPPAAARAAARALRARPVLYKSRQLSRVAPALVASAPSSLLCAASSIRAANRVAEGVRESFKREREQQLLQAQPLRSDASNADKYERRLKMNRWSAAASRVRRDAYTKALEAELVKMENAFRAVVARLHAASAAAGAAGADGDGDGDGARRAELATAAAAAAAAAPREEDALDEWLRYVDADGEQRGA